MLSILIPTFNHNVYPLAQELVRQTLQAGITFELICIDDGSLSHKNELNKKINTLQNSVFIANKKNSGLASIRQHLVEKSKFDWLLFIDADMLVINSNFIANYAKYCEENLNQIIFGSITYVKKNSSNSKLLRIVYGRKAECKTITERNKEPYRSILCSNIIIKRDVFSSVKFDIKLKQYGYEDALFAYHAQEKKITVKHIDNPLLHNDSTPNLIYINKTEHSLQNLKYLIDNNLISSNFINLSHFYKTIKTYGLHYLFYFIYFTSHRLLKKQLTIGKPSIFIFNVYKISYFSNLNLSKSKKNN